MIFFLLIFPGDLFERNVSIFGQSDRNWPFYGVDRESEGNKGY